MLFDLHFSEENEDVLQKYHYSHDRIKEHLAEIAENRLHAQGKTWKKLPEYVIWSQGRWRVYYSGNDFSLPSLPQLDPKPYSDCKWSF